jgi:hypothetical protein
MATEVELQMPPLEAVEAEIGALSDGMGTAWEKLLADLRVDLEVQEWPRNRLAILQPVDTTKPPGIAVWSEAMVVAYIAQLAINVIAEKGLVHRLTVHTEVPTSVTRDGTPGNGRADLVILDHVAGEVLVAEIKFFPYSQLFDCKQDAVAYRREWSKYRVSRTASMVDALVLRARSFSRGLASMYVLQEQEWVEWPWVLVPHTSTEDGTEVDGPVPLDTIVRLAATQAHGYAHAILRDGHVAVRAGSVRESKAVIRTVHSAALVIAGDRIQTTVIHSLPARSESV